MFRISSWEMLGRKKKEKRKGDGMGDEREGRLFGESCLETHGL